MVPDADRSQVSARWFQRMQSTRTLPDEAATGRTALHVQSGAGRVRSVERRSTWPARVAVSSRRASTMLVVRVTMTVVSRCSVCSRWSNCWAAADARLYLLGPDCRAGGAASAYNDRSAQYRGSSVL